MRTSNNILITGGAGFIGRWAVKAFLAEKGARVAVIDDMSNGCAENIAEFGREPGLVEFIHGPVESSKRLDSLFKTFKPRLCVHLAAQIVVQDSIDDPAATFRADVEGTFRLLELCRKHGAAMLFMSTCMVYDLASQSGSISEKHPVVPRSPYAGAKLSGEFMAISYAHAYNMPVTVMRPFNTYGPHQKSSGEGGVVSIFLSRMLRGEDINIYGDGKQTRDLLYVQDCADFILRASASGKAQGKILNAGTGRDVSINDLAKMTIDISPGCKSKIKHVKHIHPQSEIMKLKCNARLAKELLGWKPSVKLEQGLRLTGDWIAGNIAGRNKTWG